VEIGVHVTLISTSGETHYRPFSPQFANSRIFPREKCIDKWIAYKWKDDEQYNGRMWKEPGCSNIQW
jgi:hypothetical protein